MAFITLRLKLFYKEYYFLFYLALIKLFIHFISNGFLNYGIFRDEFYYIACSDHLALGYVDQPPVSIALLAVSRFLFGETLFFLRLFPAFAGAITVFMTGLITEKLGGDRFAQTFAACAALVASAYLNINSYYSMNSFDILFWTIGLYLILLIMQEDKKKYWLWLGLMVGLGLLNKISMIWFIGGFGVGLLLTKQRKKLLTAGPWLAALFAFVLFLPHIIWQIANGFPTLEFMKHATTEKMVSVPYLKFLLMQIDLMNPFLFPLWCGGLLWFLFHQTGIRFRLFGLMYLSIFLLLMFSRTARAAYLAPFYPVLLAGGAVWFESLTQKLRRWLRPAYMVLIIIGGMIGIPFCMPILPVESYLNYAKFMGNTPNTAEKKEIGQLGQFYADMHGWENMAQTVSRVYDALPENQKKRCVVLTSNYGEAGAMDYFAKHYPLPPSISGHNNYWLWGPGNVSDDFIVIRVGGGTLENQKKYYDDVTLAATVLSKYCMPYENNLPVYLCINARYSLKKEWLNFKHYD